jgi:retinol dehydrogenase-14
MFLNPLQYIINFVRLKRSRNDSYIDEIKFNGIGYNVIITGIQLIQNLILNYFICFVYIDIGGNCGIGKSTATKFVLSGANVIIACRDHSKTIKAMEDIENEVKDAPKDIYPHAGKGHIHFLPLDLSDLESIWKFSQVVISKYKYVDILINNGGLNTYGVCSNGLQQLFAVNYLGHYYLYRLLEPILLKSDASRPAVMARVVNLSSVMHHTGHSDYKRSAFSTKRETGRSCYSDSKLYMNYLTMMINKRQLQPHTSSAITNTHRRIVAISVNPGAVRSDIWRAIKWPISAVYDVFMQFFYLSVDQGSETSIFAAISSIDSVEKNFSTWKKTCDISGRFCNHPLLPYCVPYTMHVNTLMFECLGPFGGPQWGLTTLPPDSEQIAQGLWDYSRDLINSIVVGSRTLA